MNSNKANTLSLLEQAEQMYREVNSQPGNCAYFDADSILCEYITDVSLRRTVQELPHLRRYGHL